MIEPTTLIRVRGDLVVAAVCPCCHLWCMIWDKQMVLFYHCENCGTLFYTYSQKMRWW